MTVLVGCETSGRVRRAFRARGHDAWSCDVEPAEIPSRHHLQCDIFEAIRSRKWDVLIAFPPCTHLTVAGAWCFEEKIKEQAQAIRFVKRLLACNIAKIAIENPIGVLSTRMVKPDQIVQPWWFGHPYTKATCLWLKGLPRLQPTNLVVPKKSFALSVVYSATHRSRTFRGLANAMADQWGTECQYSQ